MLKIRGRELPGVIVTPESIVDGPTVAARASEFPDAAQVQAKSLIKLTTQSGMVLVNHKTSRIPVWNPGTSAFPFYTWKSVVELRVGDQIVTKLGRLSKPVDYGVSRDDAILLGVSLGDGSVSEAGEFLRVRVKSGTPIEDFLKSLSGKRFNHNSVIMVRGLLTYCYRDWPPAKLLSGPGIGNKLISSADEVIEGLLLGLFESDGTVVVRAVSVYLATARERLAMDVLTLLRRVGMASRLSAIEVQRPKGGTRIQYGVHVVRGAAKQTFYEKVGFLSEDRMEKLKEVLTKESRSESYSFPSAIRSTLRAMRDDYRRQFGSKEQPELWKGRASAFTINDAPLSAATVRELIYSTDVESEELNFLRAFMREGYLLETVDSVGVGEHQDRMVFVPTQGTRVLVDGWLVS